MQSTTARVLRAIKDLLSSREVPPPTIREIQAEADISSTSVVTYHLKRLENSGHIERTPEIARGIRLTEKGRDGSG